ncbi:MAG: tannase/feruloyl esterase family alpha/beta hydrolase [Gammaproteobacteria bacterium]|nr:tannase/feruloyl esterase family alpha/beta hydrolase [Gammaproteobacteria bacterium]
MIRQRLLLCACCALLCISSACTKDPDPAERCLAISQTTLDGAIVDRAALIADRRDLPVFCQVQGTIEPDIGFEARLPISDWNGKYYQSGCGGYCGAVLADKPGFSNTINEALKRGYATITTDGGHEGGLGDASWAEGDPVAVEVYAHRGIPLTYDVGTELTRVYYGQPPAREYFGGCSNGGRMAAMAAQRYPALFDGILGGGAVLNLSFNGGVYGSWVVQVNTSDSGERILTRQNFAHKLPALEAAVREQCDASDGTSDGVISAPRDCDVDVRELAACTAEETDSCFTATEKGVLEKWYQGPRNSAGEQLYPGMPAGSERYWQVWFLDDQEQVAPGNQLGGSYAKYLGLGADVDSAYTAMDFNFDRDPVRLAASGKLLDALDPDLGAFRDAGGKYLMWHGLADPLVLPYQSIDYYESVAASLGGVDAIEAFFRLFVIPGHGHCWEMPSGLPEIFDPITVLDRWVESGEAPERILARARDPAVAEIDEALLCPYPARAVFLPATDSATANSCSRRH